MKILSFPRKYFPILAGFNLLIPVTTLEYLLATGELPQDPVEQTAF